MLHLKNWKRRIACFLFVGAALLTAVAPAFAVPTVPVQVPQLPLADSLKPEAAPQQTAGHRVSTVRRYASGSAAVIGCLEDGVRLNVLGTSGAYYKIDCLDMVGYIAKTQVRKDETGHYYVSCQKGSGETKVLPSRSIEGVITARSAVKTLALAQQGVPYVSGGTTPRGFDCSGFTQYVLGKTGLSIRRTCLNQLQDGIIIAKKDLQCGDLVFFSNTTGSGHFASHVGIYLGNGKLIHAGSGGITVVDLDSAYFANHYQCARRVILSDLTPTVTQPVAGLLPKTAGMAPWRNAASAITAP